MNIDPDKLPQPKRPYRGILPFRLLDWRTFVERDIEVERLGNLVSMYNGVLLYGQSGAGKSSLLNAGLLPRMLRSGYAPERVRLFPKFGAEILVERIRLREDDGASEAPHELPAFLPSRFTAGDADDRIQLSCEEFLAQLSKPSDLGPTLLFFDQFEEFVTLFDENPNDHAFYESAQNARKAVDKLLCGLLIKDSQPVTIVFAFRDDYLARLSPFFSKIPNLIDQRVMLVPPRVDQTVKIVRAPFTQARFDDEISKPLAEKIAVGMRRRTIPDVLNLSELQTLCDALWRQPRYRLELGGSNDPSAIIQKVLEAEALLALKKLYRWDQVRALGLLSNLVTREGTRNVVSEHNLIAETRRNPMMWIFRGDLRKLLNKLQGETGLLRRSLNSGNIYYELASESLIPRLQKQKEKFRRVALVVWGYLSVAAAALLIFAFVQWKAAKQFGNAAAKAKMEALKSKATAEESASEAEKARKDESEARTIAELSAARAEESLISVQQAKEDEASARTLAEEKTKVAEESLKAVEQAKEDEASARTLAEEKTKAAEESLKEAQKAEKVAADAQAAAEESARQAEEVANKLLALQKQYDDVQKQLEQAAAAVNRFTQERLYQDNAAKVKAVNSEVHKIERDWPGSAQPR